MSSTSPLFRLKSSTFPLPSTLSRFQGAIAGAILGYLIGSYYQIIDKPCVGQTLDLSWLPHMIEQPDEPSIKPTDNAAWLSYRFVHSPLGPNSSKVIDLPADPLLTAMIHCLDYLLESGYNLKYENESIKSLKLRIDSSLQAAFVLLPILIFHHEESTRQRSAIDQILGQWMRPIDWDVEIKSLGMAISEAMSVNSSIDHGTMVSPCLSMQNPKSPIAFRDQQSSPWAESPHSVTEQVRHLVFRLPCSYEMAVMTLVRNGFLHQKGNDKPAMVGVMGALLGGYNGLRGLPLTWRYVLDRTKQGNAGVIQADRFQSLHKLIAWSTQLTAIWSGMNHLDDGEGRKTMPTVTLPRQLVLPLKGTDPGMMKAT